MNLSPLQNGFVPTVLGTWLNNVNVLILSDDAPLVEEWRAELAEIDPSVRLCLPGEITEEEIIAVVLDEAPMGQIPYWLNVKVIFSLNAGVDDLLSDPSLPSAPLLRMICPETVALMNEYVCHYVTRARGRFDPLEVAQFEGRWNPEPGFPPPSAFRVGVLGLGELGRPAAQALCALGYRVSGWSRSPKTVAGVTCHYGSEGLELMLAATDLLICMLPLTPLTSGLICTEFLAMLPRGAKFINVGRGGCVVEPDLIAALDEGQIGHATLDVFDTEPLPLSSALWKHPRVTITPHVAATPSTAACARRFVKALHEIRRGTEVQGVVDRSRGY
jgi:glyoxylate/hydroxypyruvate reductase A